MWKYPDPVSLKEAGSERKTSGRSDRLFSLFDDLVNYMASADEYSRVSCTCYYMVFNVFDSTNETKVIEPLETDQSIAQKSNIFKGRTAYLEFWVFRVHVGNLAFEVEWAATYHTKRARLRRVWHVALPLVLVPGGEIVPHVACMRFD